MVEDDARRRRALRGRDAQERHLKLRQIEVFLEAAKHENFGAASKTLGLSPAYISEAIASLERDLGDGVVLFERDTGGSKLTRAGTILAERGTRLLAEEATTRREIVDAHKGRKGPIRIAYEPLIAGLVTNGAFALSRNATLKVRAFSVDAIEADHADVVRKVQMGEVDLGLSYVSTKSSDAVDVYPIVSSPLVLIVSTRSETQYFKHYDLTALDYKRFALPSKLSANAGQRQLRDFIDGYFTEQNFRPRIGFEGTTAASVLALVRTGDMVTLNYTISLRRDLCSQPEVPVHEDLRAIPIAPPTNREASLVAILRKGSRPSGGAYDFVTAFLLVNGLEPVAALPEAETPRLADGEDKESK